MNGYRRKEYGFPVKRYCQIIEIKDDRQMIDEYINSHSKENSWAEIRDGIKSVGILEMELFISDNKVVMIVEAPVDFDWDKAMQRLATLPRQSEWEEYVSKYQGCSSTATSDQKWNMMKRIFHLYE